MSPLTLLHWYANGVTYSIRRITAGNGWLQATGPGGRVRNGQRALPAATIEAWKHMPEEQRTRLAERELESRRADESA